MKDLPPLNALKAFHAAAEHMSFLYAGQELGVSAAAVSQQVRNLESHFGNDLFVRRGNKLVLTDSGETVYFVKSPTPRNMFETRQTSQRSWSVRCRRWRNAGCCPS